MEITRALLKQLLLYLIIVCALILIVLFPRDLSIETVAGTAEMELEYEFSWTAYKNNITNYFETVWNDKSLGDTRHESVSVEDELLRYVPASLQIIFPAFILSVFLGIFKGIFDYRRRGTKLGVFGNGLTWMFQSIPDFFVAICMIWGVTFLVPDLKLLSQNTSYSFLLPTILVCIYPMMYIARITSTSLLNEDGQYYIQVARSKGFTQKKVVYRHILPNALKPVLAHMTSIMVHLLTSLLIVEYLLGYEGMSYRLFTALGYSNTHEGLSIGVFEHGVIIGISLIITLLVILAELTGFIIKRSMRII